MNQLSTEQLSRLSLTSKPWTIPALLSDKLCNFLNIEKGSKMTRCEVTQKVNEYIKANKLQNPDDPLQILPNKKLYNLLKITDKHDLTYFNMQFSLNDHFLYKNINNSKPNPKLDNTHILPPESVCVKTKTNKTYMLSSSYEEPTLPSYEETIKSYEEPTLPSYQETTQNEESTLPSYQETTQNNVKKNRLVLEFRLVLGWA